jgi:Flp pilus assembly protein TadG
MVCKYTTGKLTARARERGSSLVEASLVAVLILIPMLAGVINFGRAYFYGIEVENAADAAAQFGAQNTGATMTNNTGMITAAHNEAPDIAMSCGNTGACWASVTPSWGCECSSATTTGAGPNTCGLTLSSCSGSHLVNYVYVSTVATYKPFFNFLGLFPNLTLKGQAKVRLAPQ